MSLSHGLMEQPLVEAYVDTAPEVADWLEDNSPVGFETLRGMSDYHPEHPGGKQEGRSLECMLFPFAELGDWAHQVTVGWQITGEITMSESSLGRKAPDGVPQDELDRRKLRDERGAGQALVGRLLKGCLDRGCAADRLSRRTAAGRRRPGDRRPHRRAGRAVRGARPRRCRARDRRIRARRAAGPHVLARAAGARGERPDEHRRRAADGDAGRRRPGRHARGLVGTDHRRGRRRVAAGCHGRSTPNGPGRTRSWSTTTACGSPTRPPTTTRSATPSTSSTCRGSPTSTTRRGWSSTTISCLATAWPGTGRRRPHRTGSPKRHHRRARRADRRAGRCACGPPSAVERQRRRGLRPRLPPRREPPRPGLGRPRLRAHAAGTLGPVDSPPYYAVRVRCGALGTKGGPRTDDEGPGARRRRFNVIGGLVRRRQRHGLGHGHDLRRTRRHPRPGTGLRLPVRPTRRRPSRRGAAV